MKDLLIGFFKMLFESLFKAAIASLKKLDYATIAGNAYVAYRPKLELKAKETDSKMDDAALKAFDVLYEKFLKKEEK